MLYLRGVFFFSLFIFSWFDARVATGNKNRFFAADYMQIYLLMASGLKALFNGAEEELFPFISLNENI